MKNSDSQKTFENLVKTHERLIFKICRIYGNSEDDREDVYQDIFIQLWKSYPKFRGEAKIGTWLYRIGLNVAITQYRGKKADLCDRYRSVKHGVF